MIAPAFRGPWDLRFNRVWQPNFYFFNVFTCGGLSISKIKLSSLVKTLKHPP
jgi:hypothetical protein